MKSLRRNRSQRLIRLGFGIAATLVLLLSAPRSSAAPMALHVSFGDLYEFDVATGDYSLASTFDPPIQCHPLTRGGDALFCSKAEQFEGTWVRRLEPSTASVGWQVNFPDLEFPDGVAYKDSLLYVVAHVNQPRRYFLLTLDPATGEELARVQLPEELTRVYALAARGSELWLMARTNFEGMAARRLDPSTGALQESIIIPGISVLSDADFGPDGRLFLSKWGFNPINTAWCTNYWIVPVLGGLPNHQFSHCWELGPGGAPPTLAYFTLAEGVTPIVEVPTLGAAPASVLAALLALVGVLALRRAGGVS